MTCFARMFFAVLLLVWPLHNSKAATQDYNLDFEHGLDSWTKSDRAFNSQPVDGASIRTDRTDIVKVGGDYWRNLSYPIGHHGRYCILTDDASTGELTSPAFTLSRATPYFSFLIGGSADIRYERFELQILVPSHADATELERQITTWADRQTDLDRPVHVLIRSDEYRIAIAFTGKKSPDGSALDLLQQISFLLPEFLLGRTARLKIIDDSRSAHIAVDFIRFTADMPAPYRPQLWGFADYHTHLTNYIAFGGLNHVRTVWGVPGGRYADYAGAQRRILEAEDIPDCIDRHGGGPAAELFIDSVESRVRRDQGLLPTLAQFLGTLIFQHPHTGGPSFRDFPTFLSAAHEQMHITQVHRAWEGGLRLMTVLAVQNLGAEYITAKAGGDGEIHPSTERAILEAQVCAVRQLAKLNDDWMQIAYTPDEARDIIGRGKLALVLGIEMDGIGRIDGMNSLEEEVQYLWDLGIRQVFPVHGPDGRLGGAALFEPAYNTLTDLLNRGKLNLHIPDLPLWPARFFDVKDSGCRPNTLDRVPAGECVLFRFERDQNRAILFGTIPLVNPVRAYDEPDNPNNPQGQINKLGLTDDGRVYIRELMKKGMIVDLSHMSAKSVDDTYALIGSILKEQGHPECAAYGPDTATGCDALAYPLFVSHAHFRELSFQRPARTKVMPLLPSEYEVSARQLQMLRRTGGAVGPFVAEEPTDPALVAESGNDCAMSSKGFLQSFRYAFQNMNRAGVGLATDYTFIPSVSPRFGPHACWGASQELFGLKHEDEDWAIYQRVAQDSKTKVKYRDTNPEAPDAIERYELGDHRYDFNYDGLANYGLLPDMLQDLKNVGMTPAQFDALFASAEGFVRMWEKAVALSGGHAALSAGNAALSTGNAPFKPRRLDCERLCQGLCPESPNRGAPPSRSVQR